MHFTMTQEELHTEFDKVKNQQDWKAEVSAVILAEEFDNINQAVVHFTGEELEVVEEFGVEPEITLKVYSPGYRADSRRI